MNIVVFEDAEVQQLYPITTGRPAFDITCAGFRLIDWLKKMDCPLHAWIRPHLKTTLDLSNPDLTKPVDTGRSLTLAVNARAVPSVSNYENFVALAKQNTLTVVRDQRTVSAAIIPTEILKDRNETNLVAAIENFGNDAKIKIENRDIEIDLFDFPHEVIHHNQEIFPENAKYLIENESFTEVQDNVFAAVGAKVDPSAVVKPGRGPILLDEGASIGPYCFLEGPAYIGKNARVIEHAAIKDYVSIGHTTKIGGEIEASIIEPFSNKQHHGFLGHSYLGSWINLGAGTCNSDLKNTYGEVKMDYRGQRVTTGMQFVGCIMGDYAKSAINTGIFTGKLIGTCSMVYGFVTTNVPSFVNYARLFGQVTELPPAVMAATQQRMFARRNVQQRPCDIQLLHDMYELTRHERQLAEEPLVF